MKINENEVTDVTENVDEQATEKLVDGTEVATKSEKTYTESEIEEIVNQRVDKILPSKIERAKRKIQKDNQEQLDKYKRIENILTAGLQTDNLDEATTKLEQFYKDQGIEIPEERKFNDREIEILANAEANEIIESGLDEIVEETERLANKGFDNMTIKEKIIFKKLATERKKQEDLKELAKEGISIEAIQDNDYQEFAKNLNPNMSEKDKYEMYKKYKPKKEVKPIGSMKGDNSKDTGLKDFYSFEEASKFTKADFMKNPKLLDIIQASASKW